MPLGRQLTTTSFIHPRSKARTAAQGVSTGTVDVLARAELARCPRWRRAFSGERKDHRYYELVEDTIHQGLDYRYFVIKNERGRVCAVQPFFVLDQDLLSGTSTRIRSIANLVRRVWPRFMRMRTLMVGCATSEGHLDGENDESRRTCARVLASKIMRRADDLQAKLVVLKEFPAGDRQALACFCEQGFTRVPSFPMAYLRIDYESFDQYVSETLSSRTRKDLRKKLRDAQQAFPIELSVVDDITPFIDEVYPLYLQVYQRAQFRFEKLTKDYFCGLGFRMRDKVRFFVWRQGGKAVAFSSCLIHDDAIYTEQLGLDYDVALDLHLYYYAFRDVFTWAIANGYKWLRTTGLNYEPKLHLRFRLDPLDLYVRHTSAIGNAFLGRITPWLAPVRHDAILKRFPNYDELQ
jgi:predicted N-acyltransferase